MGLCLVLDPSISSSAKNRNNKGSSLNSLFSNTERVLKKKQKLTKDTWSRKHIQSREKKEDRILLSCEPSLHGNIRPLERILFGDEKVQQRGEKNIFPHFTPIKI